MKQRIKDSYKKLRATNILSNFLNLSSIQVSNILLLLITIRIITSDVGIEGFGLIMFAYRFATLAGTVINYGTGQSGIKDTTLNVNDSKNLSIILSNILWIRSLIFILFLILLIVVYVFHISNPVYILLATPVVLAEVFNPLCFYIGVEKIRIFNIFNLISNVAALLAIYLFIKQPADAAWVNFILGMGNVITYLGLLMYFGIRYKSRFHAPSKAGLLITGKDNFYLTVNNVSANLQQSVILFALKWSNSGLLGAYALADRVIGQCRNLLNIVTNAVYPNAVNVYRQSSILWDAYRKKSKYLFAGVFLAAALLIFVLADLIVFILSKKHDADAIMVLRIMAFVPVISALNVFSVLDMLLKSKNLYIFKIAIILVCIAVGTAFGLVKTGNYMLIAGFTIIVEGCAWAMYEYVIKKTAIKNA